MRGVQSNSLKACSLINIGLRSHAGAWERDTTPVLTSFRRRPESQADGTQPEEIPAYAGMT
jgi:hypothetical protein